MAELPGRRIDETLLAVARALRSTYDSVLESEVDLTLPQASLLAYVAAAGPLTQTAVAHFLRSGRASTGKRIDQLENKGLVVRRSAPDDRRVWLISATPAGLQCAARIKRIDAWFGSQVRAGLSRDDRHRFATMLNTTFRNLEQVAAMSAGQVAAACAMPPDPLHQPEGESGGEAPQVS